MLFDILYGFLRICRPNADRNGSNKVNELIMLLSLHSFRLVDMFLCIRTSAVIELNTDSEGELILGLSQCNWLLVMFHCIPFHSLLYLSNRFRAFADNLLIRPSLIVMDCPGTRNLRRLVNFRLNCVPSSTVLLILDDPTTWNGNPLMSYMT